MTERIDSEKYNKTMMGMLSNIAKKGDPNGIFVRLAKEHGIQGKAVVDLIRSLDGPDGKARRILDFSEEEWEALSEPQKMVLRSGERSKTSYEEEEKRRVAYLQKLEPFHRIAEFSNLTKFDFDNHQLHTIELERRPYMEKAVKKAQEWRPELKQGFFLYGTPGSGKTRLLKGIGLKWAGNNLARVHFDTVSAMARRFKEFDLGSEHLKHYRTMLIKSDLLVIDDFGAEHHTDFVVQELLSILDDRCNRDGTTHVTSNIHPKEIEGRYGRRMLDRLKQLTSSMELKDPSYRKEINKDNAEFWDD